MSVVPDPAPRDPQQRYWDPPAQTMDPERRREIQDERLREMIGRVFARRVPMFERRLREAGVEGPEDVRGADDLDRLPITVKQDLRDSEAAVPPAGDYRFTGLRDCIRLGSSTGTTGTPTLMLWTRRDLLVEYESAARNWWRAGIRPGMVVTHAHPAYLYGGGLNLQSTYEYLGALPIWVPPPDTDELAEQGLRMWQRIKPDIPFVGFSLGRFLEVQAKLGIDPQTTGLRIPDMPAGPSPLATAGAECFSFLAGACREHNGGHIADDYACVQAVDPATGREVPEGEWGDLVVTTFGRDNCMIRYDLEEACRIDRTVCPCGETTSRGWWGGRYKDLILTQGRRLQIFDVERALRGVAEVCTPTLEYAVVRPREDTAPLQVRVEHDDDGDGVGSRCAAALRDSLGIEARISIVGRGSLPRSGYKRIRVVDE